MSDLVIKSYSILHITTGNQFKLFIHLESDKRLTLNDILDCACSYMNCDLVKCEDCIFNDEGLQKNDFAWSHFDIRRLS